ncbi:hypothetical protein [Endozoicomonas elysicola]|uniref:Uncharacterized protein n=2 Tax=Endozoicomonas elysicola TaxID=305900 RepID=A0A081K7M4_9GAMM|nr:hypothetical protein [Endozoicomonas elysicola]KEI70150.1 hypothetical protein GV64_04780 [Endozoicomonas elysicola]
MFKLIDGGLLLAIISAILFSLSIANYNGYLVGLGVETGFILRNSYQILYNALFVILLPVLQGVPFLLGSIIVFRFAATVYTSLICFSYNTRKKAVIIRGFFRINTRDSKSEVFANKLIDRFFPSLIFIFLFFGSLYYAEIQGKEKAINFLKEISDTGYSKLKLLKSEDYPDGLYVITCGVNNCAAINVENERILYFENKLKLGEFSDSLNKLPIE